MCSSSTACNFQWTQTSTPTITNIDTSNQQSIILTGTGFSSSNTDNVVLLGSVPCTVTSSSATQLTCTPGKWLLVKKMADSKYFMKLIWKDF